MARQISRAEAWEAAHEVFTQINFNSYDFNSIKESLIDYTKLYYSEDFNDYIESSEFIAILELFAYVCELIAYRVDLNAHENFITAERKESILRLAKLISYKASRVVPARGLVKITSVSTTEPVVDSNGVNLANRKISWNDINNTNWKEQFILIMNRIMEQEFGTVAPSERIQQDDVLFELYTLNNKPISGNGVSTIRYSASVAGETFPMELVPVKLSKDGPSEKRPERNQKFTVLYGSDGLGDGSDTTGFFVFTKQGTLQVREASFDGITPNQTHDVLISNVNETDVWLNNVNVNTRSIIESNPVASIIPHLYDSQLRHGEWVEVDVTNAQNILFNTNKNRHKYEIETLDNDQIRLVFGDGEFSDIPSGAFDIWYRTSANTDVAIPKNAVVNKSATLTYTDNNNNVQTITFTYSLVNSLLNGAPSEDIEHIRRVAPSVYYTQDRMVNGRDYNVFMLQDPSILKIRSINRTFAGDSKYLAWHDPKEYYENVKMFGDDGAIYWVENPPLEGELIQLTTASSPSAIILNTLQPLLSSTDFFSVIAPEFEKLGKSISAYRREFSTKPYLYNEELNEIEAIRQAIVAAESNTPYFDLYYSVVYDEWTVKAADGHPCDNSITSVSSCPLGDAGSIWMFRLNAKFSGSILSGWDIYYRTRRLITQSESMKFWNTNTTSRILDYDTLDSVLDRFVVLSANIDSTGDKVLGKNMEYMVLGQELVTDSLPNAGLPDPHRLSVLPTDVTDDGVPDNLLIPELINKTVTRSWDDYNHVVVQFGETVPSANPESYEFINISEFGRTVINSTKGLDTDIEVYVTYVRDTVEDPTPREDAFGNSIEGTTHQWTFENNGLQVANIELSSNVIQNIGFNAAISGNYPKPRTKDVVTIIFRDYVYLSRESESDSYVPVVTTPAIQRLYALDLATEASDRRYVRYEGRYPLNFAWFHYSPRYHLIDPANTNIIDNFIITSGHYVAMTRWINSSSTLPPAEPTPAELRSSYAELINNRMISDTIVLHPGKFKILFGSKADPTLRATFKIIRPTQTNLTDNEVKVRVVNIIQRFFNIDNFEFGETFFFTELSSTIHAELGPEIDSVVLVPTYSKNQFGDMFQVLAREDEIFIPHVQTSNIEIVQSYTSENTRQ